jgi:hypothetical protein
MNTYFSTFMWEPVLLALIPLGMALAVVLAEVMGWVDTPASRGDSGCRCGHTPGL